jgi:hypothetical protein
MCVIIQRPADRSISEEHLVNSMTRNPDGWGVMFHDRGRVHVWKDTDPDRFMDFYRQLDGLDLAIHFRKATKGKVDLDNVHPFHVLRRETDGIDLMLMHNGTFSDFPEVDGRSDTHFMADKILGPILAENPDLLHNDGLQMLISSVCDWSRLLTLDSRGRMLIFNKRSGVEIDGCWFSNNYSHNYTEPKHVKIRHIGTNSGYGSYGTGYGGHGSGYKGWSANAQKNWSDAESAPFKASTGYGWKNDDDDDDRQLPPLYDLSGKGKKIAVPDWDDRVPENFRDENPDDDVDIDWDEMSVTEIAQVLMTRDSRDILDFVDTAPERAADLIDYLLRG